MTPRPGLLRGSKIKNYKGSNALRVTWSPPPGFSKWFPMVAVRIILFQILGWDRWLCYPIMFLAGLYIPVLIGKLALRYIPKKAPGKYALISIGLYYGST